jgi:ATP-dependent DNA helicase RecG
MLNENQNIEFKESWRDEYLKWICGFANANGGKIFIGINDKGDVIGLDDSKKLLEDIPNKIKDILGIIVDVNLKQKNKKHFIEIDIEPHPYPINYKGQYHYRTGSTKQELKGTALDKFLLQKQGKHWDSVPLPNLKLSALSKTAIQYFKKNAENTNRLSKDVLKESSNILLQNLQLLDGQYLKRAAALLFFDNPEQYVSGAYIKIGFFKTDDDLIFQDEVRGNLFEQVENTMNLLLTKYLKATIGYNGIHRSETFPYPVAAIREALLNAIAHKDYSTANPIQISVYSNKIFFYNDGQLPESWSILQLLKKHPSKPYNPLISKIFFHTGLIEAWGRGTLKIISECDNLKLPNPIFKNEFGGFVVEFMNANIDTNNDTNNYTKNDTNNDTNNDTKNDTDIDTNILAILAINKNATIDNLVFSLSKSRSTILRRMQFLKKNKQIKRIGAPNNGYWKVLKK